MNRQKGQPVKEYVILPAVHSMHSMHWKTFQRRVTAAHVGQRDFDPRNHAIQINSHGSIRRRSGYVGMMSISSSISHGCHCHSTDNWPLSIAASSYIFYKIILQDPRIYQFIALGIWRCVCGVGIGKNCRFRGMIWGC